jgi:predicted transcriptional regulator
MPTSKPMKLMTLLMDEDEKRQLQQLARDQNITLSYALREGARRYLAERQEHDHDDEPAIA